MEGALARRAKQLETQRKEDAETRERERAHKQRTRQQQLEQANDILHRYGSVEEARHLYDGLKWGDADAIYYAAQLQLAKIQAIYDKQFEAAEARIDGLWRAAPAEVNPVSNTFVKAIVLEAKGDWRGAYNCYSDVLETYPMISSVHEAYIRSRLSCLGMLVAAEPAQVLGNTVDIV